MNYTEKLLEVCEFHLMFSMVNIWVLWVQVVPVKIHY